MMSVPLLHTRTCGLCMRRPLTYRYLSSVLRRSQEDRSSPVPSLYTNRSHAGYSLGSPCAQRYSYATLIPEKKKVYRNPRLGYIWNPELASLIREKVWPGDSLKEEKALVLDCNAGPGFLTKELLAAGAPRVVSIDRNKEFLPRLQALQKKSEDRLLQVLHADFSKVHYHGNRIIRPPTVRAEELFKHVTAVSWESDIPIKVIGSFHQRAERLQTYVYASLMLERLSIYAYGRAQLNLLLSEKCYNTMTQVPGNYFKYRALSALYQLGFDIKLLHKEPLSSFASPSAARSYSDSSDPECLYLTQLTPKRDLFTRYDLSQHQAFVLVYFIRQALSKRKHRLTDMIEKWAPGYSHVVEDLGLPITVQTGDVEGEVLLKVFMAINQQDTFNGSWMGEDVMNYALQAIPVTS